MNEVYSLFIFYAVILFFYLNNYKMKQFFLVKLSFHFKNKIKNYNIKKY